MKKAAPAAAFPGIGRGSGPGQQLGLLGAPGLEDVMRFLRLLLQIAGLVDPGGDFQPQPVRVEEIDRLDEMMVHHRRDADARRETG